MRSSLAVLLAILGLPLLAPNSSYAADYPLSGYRVTLGRVALPGMDSNAPDTWCAAGIRCIQGGGGKDYLDICFVPTGVPLPPNTSSGNTHYMYRPIAEFPYYIDLLRNEKPLVMSLETARPERHRIGTGSGVAAEKVGEGER